MEDDNIADGKSIVKNAGFLYSGELVSHVFTLILVIVISSKLGDTGLGKYSFAFSFTALFLLLADFGLQTLVTKETARDKKLAAQHLKSTFTLKMLLNLVTFSITVLAIYLTKDDPEIVKLVIIAAIAMNFYYLGSIFRAVFQGFEQMKYDVIAKTAERAIAMILGVYLLMKGYGIFALFFVLLASNFLYYIILHFFVLKKISTIGLQIDFAAWREVIKKSFPFWLTLIFVNIYFRIDTIMLSYMKDFAQVGWYNAAYKIIDVLARVPFLLIIAVFPALSRLHNVSRERMSLIYEKSLYYLVAVGMPTATGLIMLSERIVLLVFGSQFANSAIALKILSIALFFIFINYLMGYLLNSIDKQKIFTITTGITAGLNIILNLILIPKHGYIGAGIATAASEILNFAMLYYFTRKNDFSLDFVKAFAKPLIATIWMAAALYYFRSLHAVFLAGIGAAVYFAILFLIRGIGKEEINLLKGLIK